MKIAKLFSFGPLLGVILNMTPAGSLFVACLDAQVLPADRIAPWSEAGIPGGIPSYPAGASVTDYGAVGDGLADDTVAINNALAACPEGQAVYMPNGTYRVTDTIQVLRKVALRGQSRMGAILKMDHSGNGIFIGDSGGSSPFTVIGGMERGSTVLTLSSISATRFVPGALIRIEQDNDPTVYQIGYKGHETWTDRKFGMVNEIVSVSGNQVTLRFPLLKSYSATYNPKAIAQDTLRDAGIENFTILRSLNNPNGAGNNVVVNSALHCWVKDIWSEKTYVHHIDITRSLQCEVRGTVVNDTWRDTGGKGYGIVAEDFATLNLIEDNSANHLRHSYALQTGATANVFGYNFSRDPYSSDSVNWIFTDLLAHGSLANYTLWEGNKVVQINMDNVHGSNPWNTAFRNFATRPNSSHAGAIIAETSNWCSLIGNVLGTTASSGNPISIYSAVAATSINHGNLNGSTGVSTWDPALSNILPPSLYRSSKPAFLGTKSWPCFGPSIGAPNTLPAEDRWYALSGTTPPFEAPVAADPNAPSDLGKPTPVVHFDCDNSGFATLLDQSGHQHDGALSGAAYGAGSHDGTDCLNFDGVDDSVTIPHQTALNLTNALTLSAWVNTVDATRNQCLLGKNNAYYVYLYGGTSGARVRVGLRMGGAWITYTSSATNLIQSNTWNHVAVTYDGANIKVYINDASAGTFARTGLVDTSTKDLELGTIWDGYRLQGHLDDVALFSEALNSTDIHALYTGASPGTLGAAGSIAHYHCNGSGYATLLDLSGHYLDGAIDGAVYASGSHDGTERLNFDGIDDRVTVPHQAALNLTSALTLSAWVNTADATRNQCILGKNNAYYVYLYGGTSGARARVGLRMGGAWITYTSSATNLIQSNTWNHVAVTYDGANIMVYINDVLAGTSARTGLVDTSTKDVELGAIWDGYRLLGSLDDVAIFAQALDADDIHDLYAGTWVE